MTEAEAAFTDAERERVAAFLNALPFVEWDRCAVSRLHGDELYATAYGWIARDDGRADFVTVSFEGEGVGFVTSSAEYSARIAELLWGDPDTHAPCMRVEHELPLVQRAVKL